MNFIVQRNYSLKDGAISDDKMYVFREMDAFGNEGVTADRSRALVFEPDHIWYRAYKNKQGKEFSGVNASGAFKYVIEIVEV